MYKELSTALSIFSFYHVPVYVVNIEIKKYRLGLAPCQKKKYEAETKIIRPYTARFA